jgi:hypothetical protein
MSDYKHTLENQIDNYVQTVMAIIGFMHLYRYDKDLSKFRDNVKAFQGRRLKKGTDVIVTPDIAIQINNSVGIVAEVKITFPIKQELWKSDLDQIKSYDDSLLNWDTETKIIESHDIALLVHRIFSVKISDYIDKEKKEGNFDIARNFYIIEFDRTTRARNEEVLFYRTQLGKASNFLGFSNSFRNGINIPLQILIEFYEKGLLYDSMPPLPYLLHLINLHFLSSKVMDFHKVRKNSRIEIQTSIGEIVGYFRENFSIKCADDFQTEYQPTIPPNSWINSAVEAFVKIGFGEWINQANGECILYFKKNNDLGKFIDLCISNNIGLESIPGPKQIDLL